MYPPTTLEDAVVILHKDILQGRKLSDGPTSIAARRIATPAAPAGADAIDRHHPKSGDARKPHRRARGIRAMTVYDLRDICATRAEASADGEKTVRYCSLYQPVDSWQAEAR